MSYAVSDRRKTEAADILLMLDAPGLGPRRVLDLLARFGSPADALDFLRSGVKTPARVREFLSTADAHQYERSIEQTLALGGDFKLWSDPDYPGNLSLWDGRPPILFFKGDVDSLQKRALALVGRVDPSEEGAAAAARFARKCVESNIAVVSGLAKGIDGASHRSALRPPAGRTYAVIAHGIDHAYPKENLDLYAEIPSNGAVISQFPTGVGPQRWMFPARNEVMCTLALGTVIIEGKPGCGSIIQAEFSFKHGRPVFLLSRNLRMGDTGWAEELVKRGAHVIERFDQVIRVVEDTLGDIWSIRDEASPEQPVLFEVKSQPAASMPTRAALFDIDGVVVDTREAAATALASIASRHTGRYVAPDSAAVTKSPPKALAEMGVRNSYDVYRREYDQAFAEACREVRVFDEVVKAIRKMKDRGMRVAAVTAQPARRAAASLPPDVRNLFELVLSYNDTQGRKDQGIAIALRRFGVAASAAVYIGDQPKDLEAARKAGVKGVGVLWGFSEQSDLMKWPHDVLLNSPEELTADLIDELVGGPGRRH
ncbi:DNA-processing protein DprA [Micromonospora gifhornensis]|uniref:DNA-processing protein DprA n=1 Tax=Micromonospora gifhornensis TaxID=84594 RepID=UPI003D72C8B8